MRIIVVGNLNSITGYGNDTIDVIRHLRAAGEEVIPIPLDLTPPIPPEVAELFTHDTPSGPADVVLGIAPCFALHPERYVDYADASIGWTMWEQDLLLIDDMTSNGWKWDIDEDGIEIRQPKRWWGCDLMLVSCEDNVAAFQHLDPIQKYGVQPMGVDTDTWAFQRRVPGGRLKLGCAGALTGRKGIGAFMDALAKTKIRYPAFDCLVELKTLPGTLPPHLTDVWSEKTGVEVQVISDIWTPAQMLDWYHTLDAYIALSTGEGNNKPAMEMMSSGGLVIASDMMGHRNWLHPSCTMAVGGQYLAHTEGNPARIFRVNTDQASEAIWWVHENPGKAAQMGQVATGWIQILDWAAVTRKLLATMHDVGNEGRDRVRAQAAERDKERAAYQQMFGNVEPVEPGETIAVAGPDGTNVLVTDPALSWRIRELQDELVGLVAEAQRSGGLARMAPDGAVRGVHAVVP